MPSLLLYQTTVLFGRGVMVILANLAEVVVKVAVHPTLLIDYKVKVYARFLVVHSFHLLSQHLGLYGLG